MLSDAGCWRDTDAHERNAEQSCWILVIEELLLDVQMTSIASRKSCGCSLAYAYGLSYALCGRDNAAERLLCEECKETNRISTGYDTPQSR